jgi:hypothetical protein
MLVSARSPLAVAAAAILAAGVVAASPGLAPSGAPQIVSTPVALVAKIDLNFNGGTAVADLFDAAHPYTYTPNVSGPSVSHPVGLISQLLQDAQNPPILQAIVYSPAQHRAIAIFTECAAEYQSYAAAANAVINKFVGHAVNDTFTPAQWGGGKVINDWVNAAQVTGAMTIGIGVRVDDKWVPSIRVAAISARNQIANDILGTQKHPNLARDYSPDDNCSATPITNCKIGQLKIVIDATASRVKPAASRSVTTAAAGRSASRR